MKVGVATFFCPVVSGIKLTNPRSGTMFRWRGGARMSLSQDDHEFAEECLRWAGQAHTEQQRQSLLEMAKTWSLAALKAEQTDARAGVGDPNRERR